MQQHPEKNNPYCLTENIFNRHRLHRTKGLWCHHLTPQLTQEKHPVILSIVLSFPRNYHKKWRQRGEKPQLSWSLHRIKPITLATMIAGQRITYYLIPSPTCLRGGKPQCIPQNQPNCCKKWTPTQPDASCPLDIACFRARLFVCLIVSGHHFQQKDCQSCLSSGEHLILKLSPFAASEVGLTS